VISANKPTAFHSRPKALPSAPVILSAEDRTRLAESLLKSLHTSMEDIEAAWSEEIRESIASDDKGVLRHTLEDCCPLKA
jgi:hypothetical protein